MTFIFRHQEAMASACASEVDNSDNSLVTLNPVDAQAQRTETAV